MKRNILWSVLLTVFIDLLGFGILIPVIPELLADPSSQFFLLPHGFSVQHGYLLLGFLTAVYPFMQFLSAPILGELSDRFGRKPILAVSLLGTSVSYVLFAIGIMTKNIPLMFASRFADGITGGNIAVAQAAIADVTKPEDRSKSFGLIGAAFGLGFIFGPFLGGVLSDPHVLPWFHAATPFWFAAILCFLNVLSVVYFLPETHKRKSEKLQLHPLQSVKQIVKAYGLKQLRPLFGTVFLFQTGFTFFTTFYSVFLITRFGFNQSSIGMFFAYIGIWIAFSQAVVTRVLSRYFSEEQILRVSLCAVGIITFLQFLPREWWWLLIIIPPFAFANGLSQANLTGLISRTASSDIQGEVLGITTSVQAFSQILPPILAGFIAADVAPTAPLIVAGVVVLFAWGLFVRFAKKAK